MAYKKIVGGLLVAAVTSSLVVVPLMNDEVKPLDTYSTALRTRSVSSASASSLTLDNGYALEAESSSYEPEGLFKLGADGYYKNLSPIRGITCIEIEYAAGSAWVNIERMCLDSDSQTIVSTEEEGFVLLN